MVACFCLNVVVVFFIVLRVCAVKTFEKKYWELRHAGKKRLRESREGSPLSQMNAPRWWPKCSDLFTTLDWKGWANYPCFLEMQGPGLELPQSGEGWLSLPPIKWSLTAESYSLKWAIVQRWCGQKWSSNTCAAGVFEISIVCVCRM